MAAAFADVRPQRQLHVLWMRDHARPRSRPDPQTPGQGGGDDRPVAGSESIGGSAKPQTGRGADHPVWGGPGWKVSLENRADMARVAQYIRDNPLKIGRPRQCWPFVRPYDGWLPGQVRVVKKPPR